MSAVTVRSPIDDLLKVRLAREIAFNHRELDDVLKMFELTQEQWEKIKKDPRFEKLLRGEIEAWESAANTTQRSELKMASMVEESLPELYACLHDRSTPLSARVELFKALKQGGGIGASEKGGGEQSERFSITINLGASQKLKFEKEMKTIEGEATQLIP